jgi:hypothetical protein
MAQQFFIVTITCSYLTGICFDSHQAVAPLPLHSERIGITEMSHCEEMIRLSNLLPRDRDMRVLKEYCAYENPGPSYTLIRHPNGRIEIAPW